jgi:hypothetical protein
MQKNREAGLVPFALMQIYTQIFFLKVNYIKFLFWTVSGYMLKWDGEESAAHRVKTVAFLFP